MVFFYRNGYFRVHCKNESLNLKCVCVYVYIYIYLHIYVCVYIHTTLVVVVSKVSLSPPSPVFPGRDGGRCQRVGSLLRWLGQNGPGVRTRGSAHGPVLPHH